MAPSSAEQVQEEQPGGESSMKFPTTPRKQRKLIHNNSSSEYGPNPSEGIEEIIEK